MVVFGFGSFRTENGITHLLQALARQLSVDFGLSVGIHGLDETPERRVDLALTDVSRELQSLHVSGLGRVKRLFVVGSGSAKAAAGLDEFLQSLASFHGKPVQYIYHHNGYEDIAFEVDASLGRPALGFTSADAQSLDVRELSSALFQEYYVIRIEEQRQARIQHIVERIAREALEGQVAATAPGGSEESAVAAPSKALPEGHSAENSRQVAAVSAVQSAQENSALTPAHRFLDGILQSLEVPFAVKHLFFRYITFRLSMGQSLTEAVSDLLPLALGDGALKTLYEQFHVEWEIQMALGKTRG